MAPGQPPVVFLSGFTAIIDIGPDGRLYVLQFATGAGAEWPRSNKSVVPGGAGEVLRFEP